MAKLEYFENPLDKKPSNSIIAKNGSCLEKAIFELTNRTSFNYPIICVIGEDNAILQKDWNKTKVSKDVTYKIIRQPKDAVTVTLAIISIVASVYTYLSTPKPKISSVSSLPEPEPSFWKKGQSNENRLGQPMENSYGAVRIFPSYSASNYSLFSSNEQYQYQQFRLGYGNFDDITVLLEDTEASNFNGLTYELTEEGVTPSLFSNNVVTSSEVSSLELHATNDENYEGFLGSYVVNDIGTICTKIEVDIVLNGLYKNVNNKIKGNTVAFTFEYREIDDNNDPIGAWQTLEQVSLTLATVDTVRKSYSISGLNGRYEVQGVRTNSSSLDFADADDLIWEGLKGYLKSESDYSDGSHLSIEARATNTLNDTVSNRVNLYATRKLPTWDKDNQVWTEPIATRSPIWAFVDFAKDNRYGANVPDEALDLDYLADVAEDWESKGIYFDFTFEQEADAWSCYELILRVGNAVPITKRGILSLKIDEQEVVASEMFNESNMINPKYTIKKLKSTDYTGLEVTYTDATTWNPKIVNCLIGNDDTTNLERIQLAGVTDRDRAYQIGMQIRQGVKSTNQTFKFNTLANGELLTYGALIIIDHPILANDNQSGYIKSIEGDYITLNKDIVLDDAKDYTIKIRGKLGQQTGAFLFEKISSNIIKIDGFTDIYEIDEFKEIPPIYVIEEQNSEGALFKVVDLQPSGERLVSITAVNYDSLVYSHSNSLAPEEITDESQSTPTAPIVTDLEAYSIANNDDAVLVSWNPANGASYYILESSLDGINYLSVYEGASTSHVLPITESYLYLRVSAIATYQGAYDYWSGAVGANATNLVPATVFGLDLDDHFVSDYFTLNWNETALADTYEVKVYDTADLVTPLRTENSVDAINYTYTSAMLATDLGETRDFRIELKGENVNGTSEDASFIVINNPLPQAVDGISITIDSQVGNDYVFNVSWNDTDETDFDSYFVYASETQGFTPSPTELELTTTNNSIQVSATLTSPDTYYIVIGITDVWTTEEVYSTEASITI